MTKLLEAPHAARPAGPPGPAAPRTGAPITQRLRTPGLYALSLSLAFAIAGLLVAVVGKSPWDAAVAMYEGSLGSGSSIGQSIDQAAPLLMVAIGSVIAARAGIFNIGQEGQLIIGAAVGASVGLFMPGPGWFVLLMILLCAAIGGALWASIAAILYYWRGVDVVIATLLLIFVANQVVSFAVNRPYLLREQAVPGQTTASQSDMLRESVWLPRFGEYPGFNIGAGIFIAALLAVGVYFALTRSRWGFRIRLLGLNAKTAHRAGVGAVVVGGGALLASGAFAGLAGGAMLTGSGYRIQDGFADNVGFDGLLVALVAKDNPVRAIPVALFFGALRAGGGFLASTGIPRYIVAVVTALLVLAVVFPTAFAEIQRRRVARTTDA
ncbi:ABC transporter permease [Streptomyces albipurpureus]|uniref:ABC transporter permease n=1 Tax=Streptomyces albipurpureus TaxID=2897419 RepID=A0ABT0UMW8_9ACTN|nr:ABC transporter permease [Streptomyces sp. CWNU-1]MCM2388601.1 ABC transporter permease [Streptomyces sp. CWNU-1]